MLFSAASSHAANATWNGTTDAVWATGTNWSATPVPGTGDTATFNNAGGAVDIIDLGAGVTINSILFDTASAAAYTISPNNTQILTWNSGGAFTMNSTVTQNQFIKGRVNFETAGGSYTITNNNAARSFLFSDAGGVTAFSGPASGAGTSTLNVNAAVTGNFISVSIRGGIKDGTGNTVKLEKNGAGNLQISSSAGGNTYTGGTYLNAGALLVVGNAGSIQSGTALYIANGTTLCSVNQSGGNYSNLSQYWNGDWTFNDSTKGNASLQQMTFNSGTVDLGQTGTDTARTVTALSNTLTVNSVISNGSNGFTTGLTKAGAGTMTLGGAASNTYTGLTTIAGGSGTLLLAKTGSAQAIAGGGLTIGSANNNSATVQYTGSSTDMMGAGTVTINGRGILDFNGKTDTIGNVAIVSTGATTSNPTPIINTAGGGNLTIGTLGITPVAGFSSVLASGTGTLKLGGTVTFTAATTGQAAINGNLDLNAGQTFNIGLGTGTGYDLTIGAIVSNGTLTKTGTGRLQLSGANSYTGLTSVSAGTLAESSSGFIHDSSALTVNGATAIFDLGANHSDTVAQVTLDGNGQITGSGTSALTSTVSFEMKSGTATAILAGSGIGLNKTTAGTVTLGGNNTYTGLTSVTAGTLAESSSGFIHDSSALTVNGLTAVFDLGGLHSDTVAQVTLDGGGQITGSGPSALTSTVSFEMKSGSVSAILAGSGIPLNKTTAGTVTLSGNNTYTGNTVVNAGTLSVTATGSLANNNSNKVFIVEDADNDFATGIVSTLARTKSSGTFAGYGSTEIGGLGDAATILASDTVPASTTQTMQWRGRNDSVVAGETTDLASDIIRLAGMDSITNPGMDYFVLQMSYNDVNNDGFADATGASEANLVLAWLDGSTWENAIDGNHGPNTGSQYSTGWVAAGSPITLGSYGVDTVANVVWAVLNHNSDFSVMENVAAIPEPGTFALAVLGLTGLGAFAWRRRRRN